MRDVPEEPHKQPRRRAHKDAQSPREKDKDRLAIPLDPVEALRGLLAVDPETEPSRAVKHPGRG